MFALVLNDTERRANYRALFEQFVGDELLVEIRATAHKGLAFGNDRFKKEIEMLTGGRVTPKNEAVPWEEERRFIEL